MIAVRMTKTGRVVWIDNPTEARDFAAKFGGTVVGFDHFDEMLAYRAPQTWPMCGPPHDYVPEPVCTCGRPGLTLALHLTPCALRDGEQ